MTSQPIAGNRIATGKPFSGFAVDDIPAARMFYTDVLGLPVTERNGMLSIQLDDDTFVLAYPKPEHVPASFTVLNLPVQDIDDAVDTLVGRGVTVLRYEGAPQDEKGILRGRSMDMGPDIAWFTDPAGNVLSVLRA
jgi:catechol 2,3-dioxygenase-like lactoylglutathione lyase family enzyme